MPTTHVPILSLAKLFHIIIDYLFIGTREERGMCDDGKVGHTKENGTSTNQAVSNITCATYDLPFGMSVIRKTACLRYLPISPTYRSKRDNSVPSPANDLSLDLAEKMQLQPHQET